MHTRTRAEDFLELVQRSRRGRLKLYIGFAAGVGKTYRMLEEARALQKRGVDIALAYVETHGRVETQALVEGLEVIPRRRIEYRGIITEEMDLEAVLARKPEIVVVDEVPHTNVPGSANKKRYQDVRAILEAGINVIGALNIQHLESLKDLVERATGVVIRETVPDSFLKEVDQVVNLDLAVEDLLERLRSGKIYAPDKVEGALKNFFKEQNLSALRELALREVAENVERMSDAKSKAGAEVARVPARVMVCMASNPGRAAALLRKGSRMAGRLNTDWFVVYVQTPEESPGQISAEDQRELLANIESARGLGAEVIRLEAPSPVPALIDFARAHGVGHIVIGRSRQTWLRQLVGQSVPLRLLREADGFDLHIVSLDEGEAES